MNISVPSSPGADVTIPTDIVACNGEIIPSTNFTSAGFPNASYTWTNSVNSIGIPSSGTGDINSFTATNTTNGPVTSTVVVTPFSGPDPATSCAGTPDTYLITVNPSPQVSISAVPGTTICSGQSVALSGIYTPQPQITDVSFANLNLVNIPNGCNGPAGCQLATSSVTSTGILPANLIGGQITSICFTLRHEDYTEFTILNFQMGANTYTSVNPAPAGGDL